MSTSSLEKSTGRRERRSEQEPTPRYMDWYTRQQQQQKEISTLRARAVQEMQEQHRLRVQLKHRSRQEEEREEYDEDEDEELVPGDSVSNQGERAGVEEATDDAKLRRLSTAERKVSLEDS